ncbi:MAG: hypothetical protein JSR80_06220 [Verrucomicrobia bacterium]|nr:hypothetical protein [Verrucomicrobiota bacterium]
MITENKDLSRLKTDINDLKTNIEKWQDPENKLGFLSKVGLQISTWWSMVKINIDLRKCENQIQKKYEDLSSSIENINSKTSISDLYSLKSSLSKMSDELQFLSKIKSSNTENTKLNGRINQFNTSINEISTERLNQQIIASTAKIKKELNEVFEKHGELSEHIHSAIILAEFDDLNAIGILNQETQMKSEAAISELPSETSVNFMQALKELEIPTHKPIISLENKGDASNKKPSTPIKIDAKSVDISKIEKEEIIRLLKMSKELKNQCEKINKKDPVRLEVKIIIDSIDITLKYMKEHISAFKEQKSELESQILLKQKDIESLNKEIEKIQEEKKGSKEVELIVKNENSANELREEIELLEKNKEKVLLYQKSSIDKISKEIETYTKELNYAKKDSSLEKLKKIIELANNSPEFQFVFKEELEAIASAISKKEDPKKLVNDLFSKIMLTNQLKDTNRTSLLKMFNKIAGNYIENRKPWIPLTTTSNLDKYVKNYDSNTFNQLKAIKKSLEVIEKVERRSQLSESQKNSFHSQYVVLANQLKSYANVVKQTEIDKKNIENKKLELANELKIKKDTLGKLELEIKSLANEMNLEIQQKNQQLRALEETTQLLAKNMPESVSQNLQLKISSRDTIQKELHQLKLENSKLKGEKKDAEILLDLFQKNI